MYFVYILTNWDNSVLYIGVTSNLEQRIWQHKHKIFEGFTQKYNVNKLVYFDNKIRKLKQQGFNYREIASMLGISYDHCKLVVSNRKTVSTHRSAHKGGGAQPLDPASMSAA